MPTVGQEWFESYYTGPRDMTQRVFYVEREHLDLVFDIVLDAGGPRAGAEVDTPIGRLVLPFEEFRREFECVKFEEFVEANRVLDELWEEIFDAAGNRFVCVVDRPVIQVVGGVESQDVNAPTAYEIKAKLLFLPSGIEPEEVFVTTKKRKIEVQMFPSEVVNNLIKVRDYLGTELATAWAGEEPGLEPAKNSYSSEEILDRAQLLLEMFPQVEWDVENIADALFCTLEDVREAVAQMLKRYK